MKEYIKLFNGIDSANGYEINDIPFTSTIKSASGESDINLVCNKPNASILIEDGKPRILTEVAVTNTWNPSVSDKSTKVIISGNVVLCGKTDCYSIEFEEGGHLTINPNARLRIWEGGIVNNDCNTVNYLTIDFGYSIAGIGGEPPQLLIHPNVIVNNTPKATIRVGQYNVGTDSNKKLYLQRWGSLIDEITSWSKEGPELSYPTWLFIWNYETDNWKDTTVTDIEKFITLVTAPTNNYPVNYTIIYEGNLLNNQNYEIQSHEGYNALANSYLGKINLTKFMEQSPLLDRLNIYLREPNSPLDDNVDFKHNTYYIYPGQCFSPRAVQQIGAFVFNYKDLVWDTSFEEDVTPTRSLLKGSLMSSKPAEIDTTLLGDPIFDNPEPMFPLE